jgi:hypothetical protein
MYTWLPDLAAFSPLESSCRFLQKCMQCVICCFGVFERRCYRYVALSGDPDVETDIKKEHVYLVT